MPSLLDILFFVFIVVGIIWPIVWRMVFFTAAGNVYDAITRKPTPPAHVDTPEETEERRARAFAMIAETERQRALVAAQKAHQN